jgi:hypothetical protein
MELNALCFIGEKRVRHRLTKELADTCNALVQPIFRLNPEALLPQVIAGTGELCQEIGRCGLRKIKDPQKTGTCPQG